MGGRFRFFSIVLINIMLLSGCTQAVNEDKAIKSVVENYFECVQVGDLEKGNEYLDSDFNYMDVTFLKNINTVKKYLSLTTSEVKSIETNGEVAVVGISLTHPNAEELLLAQFSAVKLYSTTEDEDKAAIAFLENDDCLMNTNEIFISLKKKQNNWEIVTDDNFVNAVVYGIDNELSIEILTENEKKLQETQAYIDTNIELQDFLVDLDIEKEIPVIKNISIKNNGDKDISELILGVDFISNSGAVIEQKKIKVISILDNAIKAGYSWRMDDTKTFEINNLQQEVDAKKVNVYVYSVELEESKIDANSNNVENQYIDEFLELTDYKVSMCESYAGIEPGISDIEIKNNGSKDIKKLIVTVYFQDDNNKNIAENSFMVIGGVRGGNTLKENYSWKMEENIFYVIKNLADEVDISKHKVEISSIEFE